MAKALTQRERQVATLIAEGITAAEVARRLGLKVSTVQTYRAGAYAKTRTGTRESLRSWLAAEERRARAATTPAPALRTSTPKGIEPRE